ncbi:hypothetical protein [Sessilibacter corallicola]|uniref:Uncharacterized protein n=1 Tax=Sessilibacter corallicola TaxID=2904075 RepID=A0ABQ0AA37_9GAMM
MNIKLFIITLIFSLANFAYAGSGSAILSHWSGQASTNTSTFLYLSNVSDNTINVSVTFYDDFGNPTPATSFSNFINGDTQLSPKSTGQILIRPPSRKNGFAVIEWSNLYGDDNQVALVATGLRIVVNSSSRRADTIIPINDGKPF